MGLVMPRAGVKSLIAVAEIAETHPIAGQYIRRSAQTKLRIDKLIYHRASWIRLDAFLRGTAVTALEFGRPQHPASDPGDHPAPASRWPRGCGLAGTAYS